MFCKNCGNENNNDDKFCPKCGQNLITGEAKNSTNSDNLNIQESRIKEFLGLENNTKNQKNKNGCGTGCLVAFAVLIFFIFIGSLTSPNDTNNTSNEQIKTVINILTPQEKAESKIALPKMRIKYDQVENRYWYYDKTSPQYDNYNGVYLYFGKDKNDRPYSLRFKLSFKNDDWIFFNKLIFNIDGQTYSIIPEPTDINRDNYEYIWEVTDMPLNTDNGSLSIIEKIIKSKKTIVRFEGDNYHIDRTVSESQKNAMKRVVMAYTALGGEF